MPDTKGFTIWLTGMSGAGKTTLAHYLSSRLEAAGRQVEVLDEEAAEDHLAQGLTASRDDRDTYTYRLAWVAELLSRNGVIAIVAATSPYREVRDEVRRSIGEFVEVFCDCPVEALIERDVKGLYRKALAGEIPNFTGITEPYEPPLNPEVMLDSSCEAVEDSARRIIENLLGLAYLNRAEAKVALFGKGKAGADEARRLARAAALKAARVTRSREESHKGARKKTASKAGSDVERGAGEAEPKRTTRAEAGGTPARGRTRKDTAARTVTRPTRRAAKVASAKAPAKKKAPAKQGAAGKAKASARKAAAKKTAGTKAPAKKAPSKKTPSKKKAPTKKAPAKKAPAKKASAKKAATKKAPAKKAPTKKGPAKQGAAGKAKATARKAAAKKAAPRKPARRK